MAAEEEQKAMEENNNDVAYSTVLSFCNGYAHPFKQGEALIFLSF